MRIRRVKISNFCQHKKRDDAFEAGVIGIMGRNGSGKSNYLKAIRKALTGASGNAGKTEEDVSWGEDKGAVEVAFTSSGVDGSIKRQLKSSSCSMKFGEDNYRTASTIEAAIYDILGIRARVLTEMVFVEQGKIEGILFARPADRAKALQSLFGTEEAEKIRELLRQETTQCTVESYKEVIERFKYQLSSDVMAPWQMLRNEYDVVVNSVCSDEDVIKHKARISGYERHQDMLVRARKARAAAEEHTAALTAAQAQAAMLQTNTDVLGMALDEEREAVYQARLRIEKYDTAVAQLSRARSFAAELAKYEAVLNASEPEDPGIDLKAHEERAATMRDMEMAICTSEKVLAQVGSVKECPTCHQPITALHIEEHRDIVERLKPVYKLTFNRVADDIVRLSNHKRHIDTFNYKQEMAERQVSFLKSELAKIPPVPDVSPQQIEIDRSDVLVFDSCLEEHKKKLDELKTAKASVTARQAAYDAALGMVEGISESECDVTAEEYESLKVTLEKDGKARLRIAELKGRISALAQRYEDLTAQIKDFTAKEALSEKMRQWRDMVERARILLHHDELPNTVAQTYFKVINNRLGHYMEMFEAPYSATILPGNEIKCMFGGGHEVPAERLSGGQRVILGVAFRFAVYDIFVGELGILILDEPTVFLDDDNVEGVRQLLERVRSYSKSAGLQLIVVTHEKSLAGVFDQVIEL